MSKIFLNRNRQSLGQFTPEAVAEGLKTGKFNLTDLAWREGMETWEPLSSFNDLPEFIPEPEIDFEIPPALPVDTELLMPAWERRAEIGIFSAIAETIKQVMVSPTQTFSRMKPDGGFWTPLYFLLLIGIPAFTFASICTGMVQITFSRMLSDPMFATNRKLLMAGHSLKENLMLLVFQILLSPILFTLSAFIGSVILHSLLLILGGTKASYETTFRVFCYTVGSLCILLFIPVCGANILFVWMLIALCLGLRAAHNIHTAQSIGVVLILAVLCVGYVAFSVQSLLHR
ncbi:MAG: YIP1 family protein [Chthoniobacterales bacterium]